MNGHGPRGGEIFGPVATILGYDSVMGAPFSAGHYSGRAAGDYSATFFGK